MTVESTTQALCDLALRFGEGDEESMVKNFLALIFVLICFLFTYLLDTLPCVLHLLNGFWRYKLSSCY